MATEPNGMPVGPDNLVYGGFEVRSPYVFSHVSAIRSKRTRVRFVLRGGISRDQRQGSRSI